MKIIEGHVDLDNLFLKEIPDFLSTVDRVQGYFSVTNNRLTSLKNCPRIITNSFYCSDNNIKNLVGGPKEVHENYNLHNNLELVSLEGIPEVIGEDLNITSCYALVNFKYFPRIIGGDLEIGHYRGGNQMFPKEFDEKFFRSICDIGGNVTIFRYDVW